MSAIQEKYEGWKAIAGRLKTTTKTARKRARFAGLPVRVGDSGVYLLELDYQAYCKKVDKLYVDWEKPAAKGPGVASAPAPEARPVATRDAA